MKRKTDLADLFQVNMWPRMRISFQKYLLCYVMWPDERTWFMWLGSIMRQWVWIIYLQWQIDGLMQKRCNSTGNTLEWLFFCINPDSRDAWIDVD